METATVMGRMGGVADVADSWSRFWRSRGDDLENQLDDAIPMLAMFDRLPPWAGEKEPHTTRYEMRRYGARVLNLSPALSAGNMLVIARGMVNRDTGQTPLPIPLTVSDSPVTGQGSTIYEFVLPVDRSAISGEPTTMPSAP
jgi:hypothetical protein